MAISWDSFDKIWASTSPLTPYSFSDSNYAQGWNFVGSTPPARQMWDSIQKTNDEKFKYLRDNFGTPNIVTQASQMTDTDKVYVYMGSEAGWNSGHWYYYDEGTSSWADGGVYNSVAFVTDTTLSIAGQPADAKATGDALALKSDLAGCTFTGNVSVNADFSVTGDATIGTDLSVAGDSSLTNLSVSGTTALAGTSTAVTPSADDNSTNIATTEYVQTEIKPIEVNADIVNKRVTNIEKLLEGNLYDYQADTDSKYVKTVPAGAMPYASLDSIGGKTIVFNQLYKNSATSGTAGTLTYTNNGDGSTTINGTNTSGSSSIVPLNLAVDGLNTVAGHKYYIGNLNGSGTTYYMSLQLGANQTVVDQMIYTETVSKANARCYLIVLNNAVTNITIYPIVVDLTLMFGSGNEPTTVAEFESMFPASYYSYNAGTLLSAGVTEVVSKDANDTTLQTISIPAEIQALEGYGWSAYKQNNYIDNYIDFERKVFVKRVSRFHLGGATWNAYTANDRELFWCTPPEDMAGTVSKGAYIVCSRYVNVYPSSLDAMNTMNKGICANSNISGFRRVFIKDTAYEATTEGGAALKESLQGVYLYYELATPIETDISAYLSDDNLISVESGGTLTFPNSNGTDYQIPVPSSETFMVDLQSALGE